MNGGNQPGVQAKIAFETISNDLKNLIDQIEEDIDIETEDVELIREKLKKIAKDTAEKKQ